jgi:HlyD family secretion protein
MYSSRPLPILGLGILTVAVCGAVGCHGTQAQETNSSSSASARAVQTVQPVRQTLTKLVVQPGFIKPYEQTPIYTKIQGFVLDVNVDIDDKVHKDQILAKLWVPEVEKELSAREAKIEQAKAEIRHAVEAEKAAAASVDTCKARVQETTASVTRAESDLKRWEAEFERGMKLKKGGVFDVQTIDEIANQRDASQAMVAEVKAKKSFAEAALTESRANQGKANAEIDTMKARLSVMQSDYDFQAAWLAYATIRAPYEGKVTLRNVHTGHFVQPSNSASGGKMGEPLFVIVREDIMRLTVQVPEYDAPLIRIGAEATIHFHALRNRDFKGTVTRTSYALDYAARTLMVEIHMKNDSGELRPGMYANVTIQAKIPSNMTLPAEAVLNDGQQDFCYRLENGKAIKTPIKGGVRTDRLVEVLKKQMKEVRAGDEVPWEDWTGDEQIIVSNPTSLLDGQAVRKEAPKPKETAGS